MKRLHLFFLVAVVGLIGGCGNSSEETADETATSSSPVEAGEPIAEVETPAEPEVEVIAIPDALSDFIVLPEGFIVTKFDVVDEEQKQYHVEADTRDNVDKVQSQFVKIYSDKGWEEEGNMATKGSTTTIFVHEGMMVYVQANKGNLGSIVKIDTGLL